MATVKIAHASGSETGGISGKAGDQTGRELCIRSWYKHSKGWVTLLCTVPGMAEHIAQAAEIICADNDVGYDQYENQTLWNYLKSIGFDIRSINKKVETDCARLVRVCVQYAAYMVGLDVTIPDFYTATLASTLVKTGLFKKLTDSKYNTKDDYLTRGMIQVTKTKGHTWIITTNGDKAEVIETEFTEYDLGERILRDGCEGADVKELQGYLIQLGYSCGSYGADGDFGDATEAAVEKFQRENGCGVDGEVGPETLSALKKALADGNDSGATQVQVVGGQCWVRTKPEKTSDNKLGVAKEGTKFKYLGEKSTDGWLKIEYDKQVGWISGRYGKLIAG